MRIHEYRTLYTIGFLSTGGTFKDYWNPKDAPYLKTKESRKIMRDLKNQLTVDLDCNNIIILFPCLLPYGVGRLFNVDKDRSNSFPFDHAVNYLYIKEFLSGRGIVYRDGIKMDHDKYRQVGFAMLVVQDGIAYACDSANPLNPTVWYESCKEIKYNYLKDRHVKFDNKEIIFSGFFVERMRNNTIDKKKLKPKKI